MFRNRPFTSSAPIRSHFNKLWKRKQKKKFGDLCIQEILVQTKLSTFWGPHLGSAVWLHSEKGQQTGVFALRQLKKCEVPSADIVHIYWALFRSILEYASAAFADLPKYLACYLENVQKRVVSIIWPGISFEAALDKAALSTLTDRRAVSCIKFISHGEQLHTSWPPRTRTGAIFGLRIKTTIKLSTEI